MKKSKEPTLGDFMKDISKIVEHLDKLNGPEAEKQDLDKINKDNEDFYWKEGKMVMTEKYHLKRGSCCDNGCKHCPYKQNTKC